MDADTTSSNSCTDALQSFVGFFAQDMTKGFVERFSATLTTIDEIPQFKNEKSIKDEKVAAAVVNVRKAVEFTFVHARSYIIKCHGLAEYICDEKEYTLKSVEEEKGEEFKDYLEQVLGMSKSCQKDLNTLLRFINNHGKPFVEKQEEIVEERKEKAEKEAKEGAAIATLGAAAAMGGTGTLVTTALVGMGGVAYLEMVITSVGLGVAGLAVANPVGASAGVLVGLGAALAGFVMVCKGTSTYLYSKEMEKYCMKALEAIKEMKSFLEKIEDNLKMVNQQLKMAVDNNIETMFEEDGKVFDKLSRGSRPAKRAVKGKIEIVTEQSKQLRDYCQPLRDAATLDIFIQLHKKK